jgi:UPF0716 protein FxsA
MLARILLLFTLVPLLELALLIRVGTWIGTGPTILLVLLTGIAGALLASREGTRAWRRLTDTLRRGGVPGDALLQGAAILVGGAFLVTPGVLTDLLGIGLLVPATRAAILRFARSRIKRRILRSGGGLEVRFRSVEDPPDPRTP